MTGDARCDRNQVTDLQGRQAAFGTWCASPERSGSSAVSGASRAAAHFTGLCAAWLEGLPAASPGDLQRHFQSVAVAVGPERRAHRPD